MEKAQILVVEDEAVVAMDIGECLRHLGHYEPTITMTGEDAVTKTAQMHPDLVLMDIKLKGKMDGIEAAAQIRDSYHVPVIYLTANSSETTFIRAAKGNPNGYLMKPFDERTLATSIEMALHRHRTEEAVRRSEALKQAVLESSLDGIVTLDENGIITDCNSASQRMFGHTAENMIGHSMAALLIPRALKMREWSWVFNHLLSDASTILGHRLEVVATRADGSDFPAEIAVTRVQMPGPGPATFAVCLRDITERKRTELEMERLVRKLQEAVANAKTLTGMLPICARCKKIRDDRGYWNQVERYIMSHSEATFTFGSCPECSRKLLTEFFKTHPKTQVAEKG